MDFYAVSITNLLQRGEKRMKSTKVPVAATNYMIRNGLLS